MESSIKGKYIILGFASFAIVLISSIVMLVIVGNFNQDDLVRWIVFVCYNLLGWLLYLSFWTLISDTYEIYKIKFGKKETVTEAIEVQGELSQNILEEAIFVSGPTSVPESVPESSPTKEETLIQTQPIELTTALDLHEKNRASYASGGQWEGKERIRIVMKYCRYCLPRIADRKTVNHVCIEVGKWMNLNIYIPKPIQKPFTRDINNIPLRHFMWNISERFLYKRCYNGDNCTKFIKTLFPKSFANTDLPITKNFKVEPLRTETPIDKPEDGELGSHYPEDYVQS